MEQQHPEAGAGSRKAEADPMLGQDRPDLNVLKEVHHPFWIDLALFLSAVVNSAAVALTG
jgi:hypothetical protein